MSHRRLMPRVRPPAAALAAALAAAAALPALAGCDAGSGAGERAGGGASVIAPGKPGEAAETLSAEEARKSAGDDSPNSADVRYVRMMIVHHRQALTMAGLAPDRAGSVAVERVAERIAAAQRPEIGAMQGWLDRQGREARDTDPGHDHGSMPGMATERQLGQLADARGEAFDELFLKLMITHHQGAVTMATELLASGNNVQTEEMANDVIAQQTAEIGRMRDL